MIKIKKCYFLAILIKFIFLKKILIYLKIEPLNWCKF